MKLTIVIPAYNEQDAIASTIERCLDARATIIGQSPVDDVEIIVVSDGSTDRTAEIAAGYDEVGLVVFEKNRGYGAAIKRGFAEGTGELVSFLDADGTCDPRFFATLCTALVRENASVAIGSRMGPDSRMPPIRRLGNRIYALLLSALSNRVVSDTASGMRVIRRDALPMLYPLPDGLHFTPAMSARVLMDDQLKIVERPMAYEERIGESKLHVLHDGVRFLRTILEMCLLWRPARLFSAMAAACLLLTLLLVLHPLETWARTGSLELSLQYRVLLCAVLATMGVTFLSSSLITAHARSLVAANSPHTTPSTQLGTFAWRVIDRIYSPLGAAAATVITVPLLAWLVGGAVLFGAQTTHWSHAAIAGLVLLSWGQVATTSLVVHLLRFHTTRTPTLLSEQTRLREEATANAAATTRRNTATRKATTGLTDRTAEAVPTA